LWQRLKSFNPDRKKDKKRTKNDPIIVFGRLLLVLGKKLWLNLIKAKLNLTFQIYKGSEKDPKQLVPHHPRTYIKQNIYNPYHGCVK